MSSSPAQKLQRRLLGWFALLGLLLALALYGGYRNLRDTEENALQTDIDQRVDHVRRELVATHGHYVERCRSAMRLLRYLTAEYGAPSAGQLIQVPGRSVRDVRFGETAMGLDFEVVDRLVELVGGTATIFTRDGDDFVRISTNIQRADGSRAIGTILDPAGPAIVSVRRGEAYYGVVDILGRSYITGYDPIVDASGAIIGIYYVGYLVETLEQIGAQITETRLLRNGFFALADARGQTLFMTKGANSAILPAAVEQARRVRTWEQGKWLWRAEQFPQWRFTLLAAVHKPDLKEVSWARVLPVFGLMTPAIAGALVLGFMFARRLATALSEAERLREETRKLALVASRTYNGVHITGETGRIEWVNAAFTRLTGYTAEEAMGQRPADFLAGPETSTETRNEIARARQEQRGFQLEMLNYHKSGRPIWVLVDGQPVFDEQGKLTHYLVVQVDISKRKKSEDDLRVAREAAEEANQTKSAFLANMSHELRTPMNAIIGYSEMLMEEAEDLGQDEFVPDLKKIHAAGKHLLGLINDVLDLSKIEAGKMTLFLEEFAVQPMAAEVSATIQPLIDKNGNQLVVHCPADIGAMRADVTKIRQTLFNLLSNAAKFTHNGTITLSIERESREAQDWISFRVADTGIGMTPQQLGRLFQSFVQADASTTRKYGGTGLGLAISRKFCQMMGGDITVTSEVGRGTVFTAALPARVADAASATASPFATRTVRADSGEPARQTVSAPPDAPLILAVDDDPAVLDLLSRTLAREGYAVRTAANGRDALALARELQPKLITLDVMMPSMDGWSVLAALKAEPATRAIPVVMISIVEDKPLGFALGAADYLTKPIDRAQLAEILAKHAARDVIRLALVIDDLPDNRAMLRHALEREGWGVVEAEHGKEGLARFAERKPSLILLDLMMPVMDGFEFLRELRAREDGREVPVLVVTAKELTEEERAILRAGVENIVQKGDRSPEAFLGEIREKIAGVPVAR